jgi:hypothetical protein
MTDYTIFTKQTSRMEYCNKTEVVFYTSLHVLRTEPHRIFKDLDKMRNETI